MLLGAGELDAGVSDVCFLLRGAGVLLARDDGVADRRDEGVPSRLSDSSLLFFVAGFLIALAIPFFSVFVPPFGAARFFRVVAGVLFRGVEASTDDASVLPSCFRFVMYLDGPMSLVAGVARVEASSLFSAIGTGVCGVESLGVAEGSAFISSGCGDDTMDSASWAGGGGPGDECRFCPATGAVCI